MRTNHPSTDHRSRSSFRAAGIVALATLIALPSSLRAQDPAAAPDPNQTAVTLEDFVITAEKDPRPLDEVPASVQPVSGSALKDYKIFNARDLDLVVANLDVDTSSPNNTIPTLRGLTYNIFSGESPTVDTYWNEVTFDAGSAFRALYDMGDIEAIRGPQGTLRSGSAPGGAILFTTHRPDLNDFGASIDQSFSDKSLINTELMANIPIVKGKLALRLAGLYDGDDGNYAHNLITGNNSSSHTRSIRASLEWKPLEAIDINFVYQYLFQLKNIDYISAGTNIFSSRPDLPATLSPFQRFSLQPTDNYNQFRDRAAALTVDWKLPGDNQINFIGGFTNSTSSSATSTNIGNLLPNYDGQQIVTTAAATPMMSYELRFGSVEHKFWNYDFGIYYTKPIRVGEVTLDGSQLSTVYSSPGAQPTTPTEIVTTSGSTIGGPSSNKAFFTTQSFNLTDNLKVDFGLRTQQTTNDQVQTLPLLLNIVPYHLTIPIGNSNSATNLNAKPTTGSASVSYKFNDEIHAYLSYGRSWRPGGTATNTLGSQYNQYFQYNQETSNAFELGVKMSTLHHKLQFNADVYYQLFEGYQYYDLVPLRTDLVGQTLLSANDVVVNGNAVARGVELGLQYAFMHGFTYSFDAAFGQAVWASGTNIPISVVNSAGQYEFNTPGQYATYGNVGGQRIGTAPEITISPRLEWTHALSKGEFFAGALYKYKSSRELDTAHSDILGGYGLLDLQAGVRSQDGKWQAEIWVKNALDRQAVNSFLDPYPVSIWVSGFREVTLTDPREVGITLSRHF